MKKLENPPAFPRTVDTSWSSPKHEGMTLRDYFAAAAMQGCLAYSYVCPAKGNYHENSDPEGVAKSAYAYADAMLAERANHE